MSSTLNLASNADEIIPTMAILAAIGAIVNSVEYLLDQSALSADGLLSWPVCKLAHPVTCQGFVLRQRWSFVLTLATAGSCCHAAL